MTEGIEQWLIYIYVHEYDFYIEVKNKKDAKSILAVYAIFFIKRNKLISDIINVVLHSTNNKPSKGNSFVFTNSYRSLLINSSGYRLTGSSFAYI